MMIEGARQMVSLTVSLPDGYALTGHKQMVGKTNMVVPKDHIPELVRALRGVAEVLEAEYDKTN